MFLGCFLIALSPALAIFVQVLASNARLLILTIGSSFFWLLSILLASIWWVIIPPLRNVFYWSVIWSILFQEGFRFLFFKLYSKAEAGFIKKEQTTKLTTHPDNFQAAIAFGFGSGITHSFISYISILWESLGPGTYFTSSCPSISVFVLSSLFSFCFIMFHILWSLVGFDGYRERNFKKMGSVVACHFLASFITLLNQVNCAASIVLELLLLIGFSIFTWFIMLKSTSLRNNHSSSVVQSMN